MAVTTDPFTSADLAAMIPEIWSPIVEQEFFDVACLSNFFLDLSSYAEEGGDIIHIPDVYTNDFTVQTQSTQGAEVTTAGPAQVDTTLTINTHKYIAMIIGDKDMKQIASKYDINEVYGKKIAGQLVDALEASLAALWSSLTTNTQGNTSDVLTDYDIRYAMEKVFIYTKGVEFQKTAWFFHPFVWWMQVLGVSKYYDAYKAGNPGSMVIDGNFGPMNASRGLVGGLYGRPCYITANVVGALQTYRNIFAHPHALGFAVQGGSGKGVRIQSNYELRNLGTLTVGDIRYGVGAIRESVGAAVSASSSAVTS